MNPKMTLVATLITRSVMKSQPNRYLTYGLSPSIYENPNNIPDEINMQVSLNISSLFLDFSLNGLNSTKYIKNYIK